MVKDTLTANNHNCPKLSVLVSLQAPTYGCPVCFAAVAMALLGKYSYAFD